jgi:Holliday junction resolvase RusA-like endonuclease
MTAPITLIVDGDPVAKGRPRMTRRGHVYTPRDTRAYENMVRQSAALVMRGKAPLQGAVRVELLVELALPQSWSRTKQLAAIAGEIMPAARPDIDNYVKAALDACNGIIIADDAQVVELRARKRYGVAPKAVLTVFPVGDGIGEGST